MMDSRYIIIFDGVCYLCNAAVHFIINRDANAVFCFTPMQSDLARELADKYCIDNVGVDTFILIKNGKVITQSDAALEIAKDISGFWVLLNIFRIIPEPVRDLIYRFIARNRYTLFGKRDRCMVPTEDVLSRFVGI